MSSKDTEEEKNLPEHAKEHGRKEKNLAQGSRRRILARTLREGISGRKAETDEKPFLLFRIVDIISPSERELLSNSFHFCAALAVSARNSISSFVIPEVPIGFIVDKSVKCFYYVVTVRKSPTMNHKKENP